MRFEFIHVEKALYPLTVLCAVLCVSRSGYYGWLEREPSRRLRRRAELAAKVKAVHEQSRATYGSPRVCAQLRRMGEVISPKTVAKLMRENGLSARPKRRFKATTDSRHTERIAPNLLERDFTAERPNQVWVTDVTALWTIAGWCYLAAIIDLFSRRVVGWSVSESNDTNLALAALDHAIDDRRPSPNLIHHSDRGSPYGSDDYIAVLDEHGVVRSMSRKGDCWDNAVAESFFASLEHECRRRHSFRDSADARRVVESYIDHFYNPERLHSTLEYLSPIEFELRSALDQQAA
jgi:transposase InsO family protein